MVRCIEALAELSLRRGELDACSAFAEEMLALVDGTGMREVPARGRLWRGQALAALGKRDAAHRACASALATRIENSAREYERLMATE